MRIASPSASPTQSAMVGMSVLLGEEAEEVSGAANDSVGRPTMCALQFGVSRR